MTAGTLGLRLGGCWRLARSKKTLVPEAGHGPWGTQAGMFMNLSSEPSFDKSLGHLRREAPAVLVLALLSAPVRDLLTEPGTQTDKRVPGGGGGDRIGSGPRPPRAREQCIHVLVPGPESNVSPIRALRIRAVRKCRHGQLRAKATPDRLSRQAGSEEAARQCTLLGVEPVVSSPAPRLRPMNVGCILRCLIRASQIRDPWISG